MNNNKDLFKVITLCEARNILRPYWQNFFARKEEVALKESLNRLLAKDIQVQWPVPHYPKATVDGLAVRAKDTFGAGEGLPALLNCKGEVLMGCTPNIALGPGEGMLIPTGGMLPGGADAVVMVEDLEKYDEELYGVTKPIAPGENVITVGEDLQEGEVILTKYSRIRPQEMGLLAAQGLLKIPVVQRLKIGILSTGDEIVDPEVQPEPGQTRDINGYTLLWQAIASGAQGKYYGIVKDDQKQLVEALQRMLEENDIVLLSGGSSVGARDFTAEIIQELGEPRVLFHGLALRPGKPTIAGSVQGKLIFGLPGHPASAMVVFDALLRPFLEGTVLKEEALPLPEGILTQNLYSGTGREEYVRVRLRQEGQEWYAEPIRGKSGLLRPMVEADGYVHIGLNTEGIEAGKRVKIRLWR